MKDLGELLERFNKRSVSLVSVAESLDTASAAGRLVMNIMGAVSQWEREAIGERTKAALNHKKAHRRVYSATPYGFNRHGAALIANERELRTLRLIRERREDSWSLNEIARALNDDHVPSKQGGKWYARTIKNVLENSLHSAPAVQES